MEDHFLRKSVNDITSRLDINFGSLGRPARGGRGRGRRGAITGTPEVVTPKFERVGAVIHTGNQPGYSKNYITCASIFRSTSWRQTQMIQRISQHCRLENKGW